MINLTDLGLAPVVSAATEAAAEILPNTTDRKALVPDSMLARTLYEVWSGQPVTIIDSPPGAGKSTLIVDALSQLLRRSTMKIVVACPTRRGAADLAKRIADDLGDADDAPRVVLSVKNVTLPDGVHSTPGVAKRSVVVRTIASCKMNAPDCDLLVFDEAYQATFADVACASDEADQVLMVGDPGQIGPVVTVNTSAWARMKAGPHMRAPEVFAMRGDALVLQMDATYRVGPATVEAIAPLYGFPFVSKRPDRVMVAKDGTRLPELAAVRIPAPEGGFTDVAPMKATARAAADMVGRTVVTTNPDGTTESVTVTERDVAVVVAHNVQSGGIEAILKSMGHDSITVGTADKLQGGQWLAVVALDPVTGHDNVGSHQTHPGRLCVMASRHMASLVWVHDGTWERKLSDVMDEQPEAKQGIAVRRALVVNDLPGASQAPALGTVVTLPAPAKVTQPRQPGGGRTARLVGAGVA